MHIEIHGFVVSIHGVSEKDISELCNILGIDVDLFKKKFGNAKVLKHAFGKVKESVKIKFNTDTGYVLLILHGSFFDNSPDFRLEKLRHFLSQFKHTPKQLDVAFTDDKKYMKIEDVVRWCGNCDNYCTGNLVARNAPEVVTKKMVFDRIHLDSASSKTNYGTIYVRPDTGFIRIEIKFKDQNKINYLLKNHSKKKTRRFKKRSLKLLVSCINFIKWPNKKDKVTAGYIKQPSWLSFLESDIQKISLRVVYNERVQSRIESDIYALDKSSKRNGTIIKNMINKYSKFKHTNEIINQFAVDSGYYLVKV